jgi:hypothetical protein
VPAYNKVVYRNMVFDPDKDRSEARRFVKRETVKWCEVVVKSGATAD